MAAQTKNFYSHGKLLLSAEYLVVLGAKALALPLKPGQHLSVSADQTKKGIYWESAYQDQVFIQREIELHPQKEETFFPARALQKIFDKKPELFPGGQAIQFRSKLEFDLNWGLGSSSTLISNLARWAGIDPFHLYFELERGSAYDVACAQAENPIFYRLEGKTPHIEKALFAPPFSNSFYFVYTGKKQKSANELKSFFSGRRSFDSEIKTVSELSELMANEKDIRQFCHLINEHERLIASVLKRKTIHQEYFQGLEATCKSLGAWGGDFILVIWEHGPEALRNEMERKGLNLIFTYDELALPQN